MGSPFMERCLASVAAANEYVRGVEDRALAAGLSAHFMDDDGRCFERTSEGVYEIVQVGDRWVRSHEIAHRLDEREPDRAEAFGF